MLKSAFYRRQSELSSQTECRIYSRYALYIITISNSSTDGRTPASAREGRL